MNGEPPKDLQKSLLKEVYLLLLALLTFINFFVPAMIHAVSSPDATPAQNRLWIRVIPRDDDDLDPIEIGTHIGVAVEPQDEKLFDIFRKQDGNNEVAVEWGSNGQILPLKISRKGSRSVQLRFWVKNLPTIRTEGKAPSLDIQLVIYHERSSLQVTRSLTAKRLPSGQGIQTVKLNPSNHFESDLDITKLLK